MRRDAMSSFYSRARRTQSHRLLAPAPIHTSCRSHFHAPTAAAGRATRTLARPSLPRFGRNTVHETIGHPTSPHLLQQRLMSAPPQQEGPPPQDGGKPKHIEWFQEEPERSLQGMLKGTPASTKWGWVIYRCCYKPEFEQRWQRFKRTVVENERRNVLESTAPGILDRMDWTFIEDPALEGASREELKLKFRSWVKSSKGVDSIDTTHNQDSRHAFFIYVDEEALKDYPDEHDDSRFPDGAFQRAGEDVHRRWHVKQVWAWQDGLEPGEWEAEDPHEENNEDWIKMHPSLITAYRFALLEDNENWYPYNAPPFIYRH